MFLAFFSGVLVGMVLLVIIVLLSGRKETRRPLIGQRWMLDGIGEVVILKNKHGSPKEGYTALDYSYKADGQSLSVTDMLTREFVKQAYLLPAKEEKK